MSELWKKGGHWAQCGAYANELKGQQKAEVVKVGDPDIEMLEYVYYDENQNEVARKKGLFIRYWYRGLTERWLKQGSKGEMFRHVEGYSTQGPNGEERQPWLTKVECRKDAESRGAKAVFIIESKAGKELRRKQGGRVEFGGVDDGRRY